MLSSYFINYINYCKEDRIAAEVLSYSQSGVSRMIQDIEKEWGLSLLERNRSGVRLTPEGEKLLPAIRRVVEALDSYHAQTQSLRSSEGGGIRIGAFTSVAVHWLPRIIKEYQAQPPAVDFRMLGGDYHDIAQGFASGSIDVGFVTREMNIPAVETLPLTEDRLLAVLPKDHPLAGQQRIATLPSPTSLAMIPAGAIPAAACWKPPVCRWRSSTPPRTTTPSLPWWKPGWGSASCRKHSGR